MRWMILSEIGSDEKIFLFFSLYDNSIPNLVRLSALKEVWKSPFSADRVANEKHEKINGFIVAAYQADLVCKGLQKSGTAVAGGG